MHVGLLLIAAACSPLRPEQVKVPEYPDFKQFIQQQAQLLAGVSLEKTVRLDDKSETNSFNLDSAAWAEELSFLKEINPNQPEYVGGFDKIQEGNQVTLQLNEKTSGEIQSVSFIKIGDIYSSIQGTFHEDKDVYVHHREISVNFKDGVISSFLVKGYQKMILKDTVWFAIRGSVQ